jgi:hypothetical protein
MSTQVGRPLSEASKPAAEGEGVRTKCPKNPIRAATGAFTSSWRSRVPDAEQGRGAGDRVKVRRCQTAAAGCTAEAAPGPRQRKGWHEFARRGRSMGGYSAENRHVAAMIRVLKDEAKRLVELT